MRDLSTIYYFEKLLEDAHNDLVRQGVSQGLHPIGNVCALIPEPLFDLPGCFGVRLRAPRTGSMDIGTYYMSSLLCEGCRAILERAMEGGYQFLDAILAPDACAQMNRCMENVEHLQCIDKPGFFVSYCDAPLKEDDTALRHYVRQMREHVLEPLHQNLGIDISDDSIRQAVNLHNRISDLLMQIGEYRKQDNPVITGYEFAVLCTATHVCPKEYLIEPLERTLQEVQSREPDAGKAFRARVVVAGSEVDDPMLIRLVEEAGARVVADRYCFGSLPGRLPVTLTEDEDVLTQVCRHYLSVGQCPRYMSAAKVAQRQEYMRSIYEEYGAQGIIYQQMKFCDYWGYERAYASHLMRETHQIPVLSIDRPYVVGSSGQLRTRFQAFVESLEIKHLQKDREQKR